LFLLQVTLLKPMLCRMQALVYLSGVLLQKQGCSQAKVDQKPRCRKQGAHQALYRQDIDVKVRQ